MHAAWSRRKSEEMPDPKPAVNVLFVCVGNSCRSQMAEAFANKLGVGKLRAWSAGSSPLGRIVPMTFDVMAEKGYTLEGHSSKGLKDVPTAEMDVVISMGREVACPMPPAFNGRYIEWNIPDPFGGQAQSFRAVRDLIERQVKALIEDLRAWQERKAQGEEQTTVEADD